MQNLKRIQEEIEDGGIVTLSDEYSLEVTSFSTDAYIKEGRKILGIKQRIQRNGKITSDFQIRLNEEETENLFLVLKEIFESSK